MAAQEVYSECRHTLAPQAKQFVWVISTVLARRVDRYVGQQIWPEQLRNMVNGLLMPVMAITAGSDIAVRAFQAARNVKSTCTVSYGNSILPPSA